MGRPIYSLSRIMLQKKLTLSGLLYGFEQASLQEQSMLHLFLDTKHLQGPRLHDAADLQEQCRETWQIMSFNINDIDTYPF